MTRDLQKARQMFDDTFDLFAGDPTDRTAWKRRWMDVPGFTSACRLRWSSR